MFEQSFKNIDDILHKDAGCGSELDYVEQTSWILFLKYLDDLEKDKRTEAQLSGREYRNVIAPEYRWEAWAVPKNEAGKIDHQAALGGVDKIRSTFFRFQRYLYQPHGVGERMGELAGA
jgi:type I restriction enzyme M protein